MASSEPQGALVRFAQLEALWMRPVLIDPNKTIESISARQTSVGQSEHTIANGSFSPGSQPKT
jgi:hypothetical protein